MTQKRVAAYCRVSTKKEEQEKSLESQQKYFIDTINKNPAWQFNGIYSDEESGTSTKKRKGFLQMMDDAREHKFDMILTKEISRFARNVQDSIMYTQELRKLGIEVRFLTDNISSFDADHELRFNLMSSIYQDESRRTSQRVRWGQQRQMENGVVFGVSVYGYHLKGGKLTINEDEANTVRLIYSLYLDEGMGAHLIAKNLENRGILSPSGSQLWKNASILRMLKNEKYMGKLKQKKQITLDYKTHERKINNGEEDYIIIENNHQAIISPEIWHKTQQEIANRRTKIINKSNHSNRYWLSGKIKCDICNSTYKRKKISSGKYQYITWLCTKSSKEGKEKINSAGLIMGCNSKTIHESMLQEAFTEMLKNIMPSKSEIVRDIKSTLHEVLHLTSDIKTEANRLENDIRRYENRLSKLVELYLEGGINRAQYDLQYVSTTKQLAAQHGKLQAHTTTTKAQTTAVKLEGIITYVENILDFKLFSEELAKTLVHSVVVKDRESITYHTTIKDKENDFFCTLVKMPLGWHFAPATPPGSTCQ